MGNSRDNFKKLLADKQQTLEHHFKLVNESQVKPGNSTKKAMKALQTLHQQNQNILNSKKPQIPDSEQTKFEYLRREARMLLEFSLDKAKHSKDKKDISDANEALSAFRKQKENDKQIIKKQPIHLPLETINYYNETISHLSPKAPAESSNPAAQPEASKRSDVDPRIIYGRLPDAPSSQSQSGEYDMVKVDTDPNSVSSSPNDRVHDLGDHSGIPSSPSEDTTTSSLSEKVVQRGGQYDDVSKVKPPTPDTTYGDLSKISIYQQLPKQPLAPGEYSTVLTKPTPEQLQEKQHQAAPPRFSPLPRAAEDRPEGEFHNIPRRGHTYGPAPKQDSPYETAPLEADIGDPKTRNRSSTQKISQMAGTRQEGKSGAAPIIGPQDKPGGMLIGPKTKPAGHQTPLKPSMGPKNKP